MIQPATRFVRFVKATVVGGVFVLAPVGLLVYLVAKAVTLVYQTLLPVVEWLPFSSVAGTSLALIVAVAGLIAACFLAGLLAHTALAKWMVRSIETVILSNLPGYTLFKSLGENLAGVNDPESRRAVLVRFDDHSQLGVLMESLPDGRAMVFIPNVPSPWSGGLYVVDGERVQVLAASLQEVTRQWQRLGLGSASLFPAPVANRP